MEGDKVLTSGILTSQFVAGPGWGSKIIEYLTNGEYSHVDLVVPAEAIRNRQIPWPAKDGLLGARLDGGVALRPPNYSRFTRVKRLYVSVPDIESAYYFAFREIGKPYSRQAILDMFFHRRRPFEMNEDSWYCSEYNYSIVRAGGVELLETNFPDIVTPVEEMLSPYWKENQ